MERLDGVIQRWSGSFIEQQEGVRQFMYYDGYRSVLSYLRRTALNIQSDLENLVDVLLSARVS